MSSTIMFGPRASVVDMGTIRNDDKFINPATGAVYPVGYKATRHVPSYVKPGSTTIATTTISETKAGAPLFSVVLEDDKTVTFADSSSERAWQLVRDHTVATLAEKHKKKSVDAGKELDRFVTDGDGALGLTAAAVTDALESLPGGDAAFTSARNSAAASQAASSKKKKAAPKSNKTDAATKKPAAKGKSAAAAPAAPKKKPAAKTTKASPKKGKAAAAAADDDDDDDVPLINRLSTIAAASPASPVAKKSKTAPSAKKAAAAPKPAAKKAAAAPKPAAKKESGARRSRSAASKKEDDDDDIPFSEQQKKAGGKKTKQPTLDAAFGNKKKQQQREASGSAARWVPGVVDTRQVRNDEDVGEVVELRLQQQSEVAPLAPAVQREARAAFNHVWAKALKAPLQRFNAHQEEKRKKREEAAAKSSNNKKEEDNKSKPKGKAPAAQRELPALGPDPFAATAAAATEAAATLGEDGAEADDNCVVSMEQILASMDAVLAVTSSPSTFSGSKNKNKQDDDDDDDEDDDDAASTSTSNNTIWGAEGNPFRRMRLPQVIKDKPELLFRSEKVMLQWLDDMWCLLGERHKFLLVLSTKGKATPGPSSRLLRPPQNFLDTFLQEEEEEEDAASPSAQKKNKNQKNSSSSPAGAAAAEEEEEVAAKEDQELKMPSQRSQQQQQQQRSRSRNNNAVTSPRDKAAAATNDDDDDEELPLFE